MHKLKINTRRMLVSCCIFYFLYSQKSTWHKRLKTRLKITQQDNNKNKKVNNLQANCCIIYVRKQICGGHAGTMTIRNISFYCCHCIVETISEQIDKTKQLSQLHGDDSSPEKDIKIKSFSKNLITSGKNSYHRSIRF